MKVIEDEKVVVLYARHLNLTGVRTSTSYDEAKKWQDEEGWLVVGQLTINNITRFYLVKYESDNKRIFHIDADYYRITERTVAKNSEEANKLLNEGWLIEDICIDHFTLYKKSSTPLSKELHTALGAIEKNITNGFNKIIKEKIEFEKTICDKIPDVEKLKNELKKEVMEEMKNEINFFLTAQSDFEGKMSKKIDEAVSSLPTLSELEENLRGQITEAIASGLEKGFEHEARKREILSIAIGMNYTILCDDRVEKIAEWNNYTPEIVKEYFTRKIIRENLGKFCVENDIPIPKRNDGKDQLWYDAIMISNGEIQIDDYKKTIIKIREKLGNFFEEKFIQIPKREDGKDQLWLDAFKIARGEISLDKYEKQLMKTAGALTKAVEACEKAANGNGHKPTDNQNVSTANPDVSEENKDEIQSGSPEVISKEIVTEVTKEPETNGKEAKSLAKPEVSTLKDKSSTSDEKTSPEQTKTKLEDKKKAELIRICEILELPADQKTKKEDIIINLKKYIFEQE